MHNDPLYQGKVPVLGTHEKLKAVYSDKEYKAMMDGLKRRAEALYKKSQGRGSREERIVGHAALQMIEHENPEYLNAITKLKRFPVTIDEFIESKEFLAGTGYNVWDAVVPMVKQMNPDVLAGEPAVTEAYLAGATNTAKTARGLMTNLYQMYLLTCFEKPQTLFGLDEKTPIVFMFQAVSQDIADKVVYKPFREMFLNMPYTQKWVNYDKYKEAELHIEPYIQAYPRLPNVEALVGQAIIGGIIDECNFYSVITESKLAVDSNGVGGHFDQAQVNYNTLSRRRSSRFMTKGVSIGTLVFSSSIRYETDFLERRIEAATRNKEPNRYISRAKTYEIIPASKLDKTTFDLLVGNREYGTRILTKDDVRGVHYPEDARVEKVPTNYKVDFLEDPENALRDIIGIATNTITPFISRREKIYDSFKAAEDRELVPYVMKQNVDLLYDGMPVILPERLPEDKTTLRYVHVDLAYSSDRCGIAVVKPAGHVDIMSEDGIYETLPYFEVELAISIKPHPNQELEIADVRQWILNLQEVHGIPIAHVSYDGFESKESRQLLRRAGISTKLISVDRKVEPYQDLKRVLYQDRIAICENDLLATELSNLEYIAKKDKVDHPPKGSKDLSDAVAGAVHSASQSRTIRSRTNVSGRLRDRVRGGSSKRRSFRGQKSN